MIRVKLVLDLDYIGLGVGINWKRGSVVWKYFYIDILFIHILIFENKKGKEVSI